MPFKIKRDAIFMSAVRLGSLSSLGGGTSISAILAGSVSLTAASTTAGSYDDSTATITGLNTGHKVFLSGKTNIEELVVTSACASAANTLTVTLLNTGSATTADSSMTLHYLAIRDA